MSEYNTDHSESEGFIAPEQKLSILDDQDVQELIEHRKIQPEDFSIIENLSRFTKTELISNFHNYFTFSQENSTADLERDIAYYNQQLSTDPNNDVVRRHKELSEWYLEICRKYNWATAHNINRVLERLNSNAEFSTIND